LLSYGGESCTAAFEHDDSFGACSHISIHAKEVSLLSNLHLLPAGEWLGAVAEQIWPDMHCTVKQL
jgi:hypothetical protein